MINEETARATAKLAALCAKAEHCTGEMDKKLPGKRSSTIS